MKNTASLLTAMLGRLGLAVAGFMTAQMRPTHLVWLGTQAYAPVSTPNQPAALPAETWLLLTHRINRIAQRLRALFARYQAGTLPNAPRPSRAGKPSRRTPEQRLPTTPGWINARIPAAAPCAGTLEILLQTPDMRDFVTAAPQAGRLLRPLCRMLAIPPPDYLRLPTRPSYPPPAKRGEPEGGSSNTAPAQQKAPSDRPLPAHVRAAARAWKKYDR